MVVIAEEVENANRSPLYIGRPVESLAFLNRRDALRSAAEAALARRRLTSDFSFIVRNPVRN